LREPLAVTQVDKDDAAVVARGIHPTDQADGFADVGFFEFVAVVCAHVIVLKVIGYWLLVIGYWLKK
jgi:hypothetical protein